MRDALVYFLTNLDSPRVSEAVCLLALLRWVQLGPPLGYTEAWDDDRAARDSAKRDEDELAVGYFGRASCARRNIISESRKCPALFPRKNHFMKI